MASCEKCWGDAYTRMRMLGGSQVDHYDTLTIERDLAKTVCTPREQAGQWWDEERQVDTRFNSPHEMESMDMAHGGYVWRCSCSATGNSPLATQYIAEVMFKNHLRRENKKVSAES